METLIGTILETFENQDYDSDVLHSGSKLLSLLSKIFPEEKAKYLATKIERFSEILTHS